MGPLSEPRGILQVQLEVLREHHRDRMQRRWKVVQVGRRVVLSTSRELHDGRAQTVLVRTPKGELGAADDAPVLECLLPKGAHITISCARGTRPTYSNVLIAKSTDEVIRPDSGPISVRTMAVDPAADAVNIPSPTPTSSMQTPSDSKPVRIEGVVGVLVKLDAGTRAALAALPKTTPWKQTEPKQQGSGAMSR